MISSDSLLLENAFGVFNKIYFNDSLPKAVITIQSNVNSYGYFTTSEVWKDAQSNYHEINLSAEYLNRNIENVLATLLHEMVHLSCKINNIKDTSNKGRYHNKKFKEEAEKRDLIIEHAPVIGYSVTSPSQKFIEILKSNGLYVNINHFRTTPISDVTGKKKTSTRKYICEGCGVSVRATKDVNIICADCMNLMNKGS